MKVSELGEFGLIGRLSELVSKSRDDSKPSWKNLLIGIGDDTAAWRCDASLQLATVDCLVQDVHFSLDISPWEDLGWKALAVNLSDIAAMGGFPRYAMVSLGLPGDTEVDDVLTLYRGMLELAKRHDVAIAGGNISRAPVVFIDVTVLGSASGGEGNILTRSAARPGDKMAVTGYLGSAAAGLKMLITRAKFSPETTEYLKKAFLRPEPRLAEGQVLVAEGVKAAIDVSDGLLSDLRHICKMSKVGARVEIERVPVHPLVKAGFGAKAMDFALAGGEDYELLFTAGAGVIERVRGRMTCPVTVIGEITEEVGKVVLVDKDGNRLDYGRTGWDHFRSGKL